MPDVDAKLFEAIAFAARAHLGQVRKDEAKTPYVSHVFRVAMVVRHVFGIDDATTLIAAVLHDTIEDTTKDYDDIHEHFGKEVADCVAALTKAKHMPDAEREKSYCERLQAGGWRVIVCKLADIYDNLGDSSNLDAKGRRKSVDRTKTYLDALASCVTPESQAAFQLVLNRWTEIEKQLAKP